MKTLIAFMAATLTVITAAAQAYSKDGAFFRINDSLTLKCILFQSSRNSTISIVSTNEFNYPRDRSIENTLVSLKDRSAIKRSFQETFTPAELELYNDVILTMGITHDGLLKPVDAWFTIPNQAPGNTISPNKFAILRQKLLDYVQFTTPLKLNPDLYYSWSENLVMPISYYLQSE